MTVDFRIEIPVGRFPAHNPRECSTFAPRFWLNEGAVITPTACW